MYKPDSALSGTLLSLTERCLRGCDILGLKLFVQHLLHIWFILLYTQHFCTIAFTFTTFTLSLLYINVD